MKGIHWVVLLAIVSQASSSFLTLSVEKLLNVNIVTKTITNKIARFRDINEKDVTMYLYSTSHDCTKLTSSNLNDIDYNSTLVFIVHGWTSSINESWMLELTQAYLDRGKYNVVTVDWSKLARKVYSMSAGYVEHIGRYLGKLINKLHNDYGADLKKIQITGHSLGAHVAGFAGKTVQALTNSKVGRITGLDPAAPLFEGPTLTDDERLVKEDADLVVIVHTDGGILGYADPAGHIDFFPNGGSASQPGCMMYDAISMTTCSHLRSIEYFIEAVRNSSSFVATECSSYVLYILWMCYNGRKITMGADLTSNDEGQYYLTTNSKPQFSKT